VRHEVPSPATAAATESSSVPSSNGRRI